MNLTWRFETHVPYGRLIAVVNEDGDGFSAEIEGKIVASPRTGDARIRDRINTDQHYGPESVRAQSLEDCGTPSKKKSRTTSGQLASGLLNRVSPCLD